MATDTVTRTLPGSYSEMYPGRFLKSDMLKGQKVTITITDILGEDLIGENNKAKSEWIVKIKERPLQLVLNKTNGFCLYRMFGGDPHSWIGKRITIYPTTTKFGKDTVDAIRVWGSPDIAEDMEITVPQGRKKAWNTVMHAVKVAQKQAPASDQPKPSRENLDPRILAGLNLLAEADADEFLRTHASYSQKDMLAALNARLDENAA